MEELKADGIGGEAVEPNAEGSETWKEWVEKVNRSQQEKLSEIKKALKGLIDRDKDVGG
jgi:hypothetical protein